MMYQNYFYGQQSEQFSFYRIPKALFMDERYSEVSCAAKALYGILLDRMNLSAKNGWLDELGRVYIVYTIEEIMRSMSCGNKKAGQLLAEFESIGLVIRKRQGMGRPNLIYVMNFIESGDHQADGHFKNRENDTSGSVETTFKEVSERHGSNTDYSKTDKSNTDLSYPPDMFEMGKEEMRKYQSYEDYFRESLAFESLIQESPEEQETMEGILSLLVDACCSSHPSLKISGEDKPTEVVRSRFMKLNEEHIRYVLQCLQENPNRIRNAKQYLLAALYNAPDTISTYYQSWVNNDLAAGRI